MEFKKMLESKILLLDGATGTEMMKNGMPQGVCPEKWAIENPELLENIQKNYIEAGSNIIYTFSFGGNKLKLEEYGLKDQVYEINKQLAQISKRAAGDKALVAGDMSPTGQYMEPLGAYTFEEIVDNYKAQAKGLYDGGVDLFVIETMLDIQEARAALLAVKETCNLPVMVSMTYQENQRTLTGTDPITALIILQSLGADAVGCNCSTGPDDMVKVIEMMKPYANVPLFAKPNAGLPQLIDGKTQFTMDADTFAEHAPQLIEAGASIIGGCCGTSPEYIKKCKEKMGNIKPIKINREKRSLLASGRNYLEVGFNQPVSIVGERINPTGKKALQEELRQGNLNIIRDFAVDQINKGATILDVNVGMNGIDEKDTMVEVVKELSTLVYAPLCLDSSNPDVIEAALRIYPGRALINSISLEKEKIEKLLPIASKYGAMFILLPLSDEGLPKSIEEKHEIVETVYKKATEYGFTKEDIIVDGLVMTVSSNQNAAKETLQTIEWCTNSFGVGTIMGLSNVSFGLPSRGNINATFLAMAIGRGLTMAIANPNSELLMNVKMAGDVLIAKDMNSQNYINKYGKKADTKEIKEKSESELKEGSVDHLREIYNAVIEGYKDKVIGLIKAALENGAKPKVIVEEYMIPAITQVGDLFEKEIYFLPQLILSAETMKKGFELLEPLLAEQVDAKVEKVKVIIATVEGDIHDIGKNIVGLMLKNHNFEVIDLGKDVKAQRIIDKAKEIKAEIICLSALMTTTMVKMKDTIELVKEEKLNCKVMIGGAVVTEEYAKEIGADGYSKDANEAVKLAKELSGRV